MVRNSDLITNGPDNRVSLLSKVINGLIFQCAWMACVVGGATGFWWLGPLVLLGFGVWQVPRSRHPQGEVILASIALVMGLIFDTALIRFDLVSYPQHGPMKAIAPVWIVALWVGFSLTLNHSLAWLRGRPMMSSLLGGVAGPFSYWVGARTWGAIEFVAPSVAVLGVLAIGWATMTPLLVAISQGLDRATESNDRMRLQSSENAVSFAEYQEFQ